MSYFVIVSLTLGALNGWATSNTFEGSNKSYFPSVDPIPDQALLNCPASTDSERKEEELHQLVCRNKHGDVVFSTVSKKKDGGSDLILMSAVDSTGGKGPFSNYFKSLVKRLPLKARNALPWDDLNSHDMIVEFHPNTTRPSTIKLFPRKNPNFDIMARAAFEISRDGTIESITYRIPTIGPTAELGVQLASGFSVWLSTQYSPKEPNELPVGITRTCADDRSGDKFEVHFQPASMRLSFYSNDKLTESETLNEFDPLPLVRTPEEAFEQYDDEIKARKKNSRPWELAYRCMSYVRKSFFSGKGVSESDADPDLLLKYLK